MQIIDKPQGLNARYMVIALLAVGVVTAGNLWIHRGDPPLGHIRYTGYGVSFDYDIYTYVQESDVNGGGSPSEAGGSITVVSQSESSMKQYGIFWAKPETMPPYYAGTAEGAIDFLFGAAGMSGTQIVDRGEYSTTTKDGYKVLYQTFGVAEGGFTLPGVMGAWYNEGQARYILVYLINVPDFENIEPPNEALVETWVGTLGSIRFAEVQD